MDRREFLLKSALLSASTLLPFQSIFAADRSMNVFEDLRGGVGTFTGRGGTIGWLINNDGVVIIDSQYLQTAEACISGLRSKTNLAFDYLINTHHHGDHTGGNKAFLGKVKAIVAHENVPALQKAAAQRQADRRGPEVMMNQAYANEVYSGEWSTQIGDETIRLKNYGRGHTAGDSLIYFEKANVAHMGDLVFHNVYPFIDRSAGASVQNWINVNRAIAAELPSDCIYIFGHGRPETGVVGNKDDVLAKANYLEALLEYTRKAVDAGKPLEEITGVDALPGQEAYYFEDWGLKLDSNITATYQELTED